MACPHEPTKVDVGVTAGTAVEEPIDHSKLVEIPSPRHQAYFGLLGHAPDLDATLPVSTYWRLMDEYDPIYKLDLGMAHPRVFVGTRDLVDEMADDSRFTKFTHRLHKEMSSVVGDGLFSAESTSKNWWKAHRLLVPAFGPIGLKKMFDDMQDLSAQMILKWDRFGPEHVIEAIDDTSRLAFDTVGLCVFGYRFNEFYSEAPHPFQVQLKEAAIESGRRANRPEMLNHFYYREEAQRQENIRKMKELCKKIIRDRLDNPKPDANDLLNILLHGVDRETGEKLSLENVEYQIPTFFGAGYETTSATLAFVYYFLCNNPKVLKKAQEEVDQVVGDKVVSYEMLPKLAYLDACIKETLRLQHPSSLLTRFAIKDTVIGGKYFIHKGQMVSGVWRHFHRDHEVWGDDADEFRPERMLQVNFEKLPPNAWKPYGDGLRACIGRGFAEQEMLINLAMILQKFDMEKYDPDYELRLRGQMALKPIDFKIRVRRRPGRSLMVGIPGGGTIANLHKAQKQQVNGANESQTKKPIAVLWGGNMGTSETLAHELVKLAPDYGLDVVDLRSLDAATDNLPLDKPIVIITPSYDGRPPDNGKKFFSWIEQRAAKGEALPPNTQYAVFGLGNSDWNTTFHRIPKAIDEAFSKLGAERIINPGFANVKQDMVGPWETWSEQLCVALSGISPQEHATDRVGVEVQIVRNSLSTLPQAAGGEQLAIGTVTTNYELADTSVGSAKRHIDIRLPPGCEYRSGDHLAVLGRNPEEVVARVMKRFSLGAQDVMSIQTTKKDFLPAVPMAVEHFLLNCVELSAPISQRQLATLSSMADKGSKEQAVLDHLRTDASYDTLLEKRFSVIDVLDEVPGLDLPFGVYVDMLLPMTPRLYSLASSPLDPTSRTKAGLSASITFDVLEGPATSGHGTFHGVASTFLASRKVGDQVTCLTRPTLATFKLPASTETPIVMFAAGSGIAPMRAFIQERAALKKAGSSKLGPAVLFYGCRHPEKDYLYRDELTSWEKEGLVDIIPCFSRPGEGLKGRYVSDAIWEHRDRVWDLFNSGAKIFVCGSAARLGRSSADTWRRVYMEKTGKGEAESHEWFDEIKNSRYVSDTY